MLMWFWLRDRRLSSISNYWDIVFKLLMVQELLGELDFLIKNTETNQIEHWEVALKYYLGEADLSLTTLVWVKPYRYFKPKTKTLYP